MHLWCYYNIFVSIHVHIYCKQCFNSARAVETISPLLQMHHSCNAPPDLSRGQCECTEPRTSPVGEKKTIRGDGFAIRPLSL